MVKLMIHNILYTVEWSMNEMIIKGEYVLFVVAATPAALHFSKFDLRIIGKVLTKFGIYFFAQIRYGFYA